MVLKRTKAKVAAPTEAVASAKTARPRRAQHDISISMRVSPQTLDVIDSAAVVTGKSRTEFVMESARTQAIDVLLDQRLFVLTEEQHDAFMRVLDNPPAPGPKLKALMKRRPLWQK